MELDSPDFELVWPPDLFVEEATAIRSMTADHDWEDRVALLLEDAFVSQEPAAEFRRANKPKWPGDYDGPESFLELLIANAYQLKQETAPKPYYPQRKSSRAAPVVDAQAIRREFVRMVTEFEEAGYLGRVFPKVCVDDRDGLFVNRSDFLAERLGVGDLWPLYASREGWDEDTFYGLIEVFHDAVARPRYRWWHDYSGCGFHYSEFSVNAGRRLYRWRMNRLLDRSVVSLRLADDGEDVGRLVAVTDEGRAELLERLLSEPVETDSTKAAHAISLYRARGADDESKRSAVISLAGVLESRRGLLQSRLLSKDEGALFEIANKFAIRHQGRNQQGDYDPAFLDWIFWWYAATVELIDRLIARS